MLFAGSTAAAARFNQVSSIYLPTKSIQLFARRFISFCLIASNGWCWTRPINYSKREKIVFASNSIRFMVRVRMKRKKSVCSVPHGRWPCRNGVAKMSKVCTQCRLVSEIRPPIWSIRNCCSLETRQAK